MKILSALLGLVILLFVLSLALSNQQSVSVGLWPLTGTVDVPVYLVALLPLAGGLVIGGFWGWVISIRHRWRSHKLNKELGALNERIGELQKSAIIQTAQITPKKSLWRRS